MHRYNNADHSMLTALLTSENIRTATTHDVWSVNVEDEYHEETTTNTNNDNSSSGNGGNGNNRAATRTTPRGTGRDAPLMPRPREEKTTAEV